MSIYDQFSEAELEILRERAERAASISAEDKSEAQLSALTVTLQGERYALPLDFLTAVYERVPVVPVPCTPPYVAGIANIRGRILPVLDLAVLMGLPGVGAANTQTLVVAAHDLFTVALRVDTIGEAAGIPTGALAPVPSTLAISRLDYLQGILADGTAMVDLNAILHDPTIVVNNATD